MAGKIRGKSHEAYYARYKSSKVWEQNRLRKLKRALKRNPENAEQINKAMANVSYRRKTPTTPAWSASRRREAELYTQFKGFVPKRAFQPPKDKDKADIEAYFSSLSQLKPGVARCTEKVDFSIGARISTKL